MSTFAFTSTTCINPAVDHVVTVAYHDGEVTVTIHADGQRIGVSATADFEGADLCGAMHAALAANGFNVYSVGAIEPDDEGVRWIPTPRPEVEIERHFDGTVRVVEGILGGRLAIVDEDVVPADWQDLGPTASGQRLVARPLTAVYETAERLPAKDDLAVDTYQTAVEYRGGNVTVTLHGRANRVGWSAVADFADADLPGAAYLALARAGVDPLGVDIRATSPDGEGIHWLPDLQRPTAHIARNADGTVRIKELSDAYALRVQDADAPSPAAGWRDIGRDADGRAVYARPMTMVIDDGDVPDMSPEPEVSEAPAIHRPDWAAMRAYEAHGILSTLDDALGVVVVDNDDDAQGFGSRYGHGFSELARSIRDAGEKHPVLRLDAGLHALAARAPENVCVRLSEPEVRVSSFGDRTRYFGFEIISWGGCWTARKGLVAGVLPVHQTGGLKLEPGHALNDNGEEEDDLLLASLSHGVIVNVTSESGDATTWRFLPGTIAYRTMCEWAWSMIRERITLRTLNGEAVYDEEAPYPDGWGDQPYERRGGAQ